MPKKSLVSDISEKDFDGFIKNGLVLVDFFADWCMPCVMMAPIMDELSIKLKGKINFGKVDIEQHNNLAQRFHIHSIPNFVLFRNGEVASQFVGSMPLGEFEKKLKEFL